VTTDPLDYPFWLASRSAGVVAYLLLSAAVVLGLATTTRLARARALHERVALLALGAVAAHGLFLLPDGWLRPSLLQLLVPFTLDYRPVWTGLGICAAYGVAGLSLTHYARRRLGARRWRSAHRLIPIAWALAAVHVIGAGTDAVSWWLRVILAATIAAITVLIVQRGLAGRTQPAGRDPARTGGGSAGTEPAPTEPAPDRRDRVPAGAHPPERKYAGELGLFR
jgi:sulfoxide reductase heme-binding subunit YedZ